MRISIYLSVKARIGNKEEKMQLCRHIDRRSLELAETMNEHIQI